MRISRTIPFLVVAAACGPVPPEESGAPAGLTTRPPVADAGGDLALDASLPSGAMVGTRVTWTATPGASSYRFVVKQPDHTPVIVRDFDVYNSFAWTPFEEGRYEVRVIARGADGRLRTATAVYSVRTRVVGREAVVSPTLHPLVALYSAPPCPPGRSVRVQFRAQVGGPWRSTPDKRCRAQASVNFLVAGMYPRTTYELRHEVRAANQSETSSSTPFTTGLPEVLPPPSYNVLRPPDPGSSLRDDILVHSVLAREITPPGAPPTTVPGCPVGTDLLGNMLWYYKEPCLIENLGSLMSSLPSSVGGTFLMHMSRSTPQGPIDGQVLREIDLAGNTLRETNVGRVNEQLQAQGHDPIYRFHHETRRLPNGHTVLLGGVERVLTNVQGPGPVDVVGDMVIDLDPDWQVAWAWNSFSAGPRMPPSRRARREEVCTHECGVLRRLGTGPGQAPVAHDWTHGNAIIYAPDDGSLLVSFRHQDWIVKLDYADGRGSGRILWRLGDGGDFAIRQAAPTPDPAPWFSGQHQPVLYARSELVVHDNSNARNETVPVPYPPAHSRGQVYRLDEASATARLVLNTDLGAYSSYLGSAQKLSNGNYHFLAGGIAPATPSPDPSIPRGSSRSVEVDRDGALRYVLEAPTAVTYRSFRMRSLYQLGGIPGDVDGDGDVDLIDVALIHVGRPGPASGPQDPRDLDGDLQITGSDVELARAQCTRTSCRPLDWETTVMGF